MFNERIEGYSDLKNEEGNQLKEKGEIKRTR